MPSNIYLIWQDHTSLYKIGMAANPAKRLKDLQTGHSNKLHLIANMECQDAIRKESYLHRKYSQYRTNGEWFSFPPTLIHRVFEEFQFHVEETPDECVHYWAALAQKWRNAAKEGLDAYESISRLIVDYCDADAVVGAAGDVEHRLLMDLIKCVPTDVSATASFARYQRDLAEVKLVASQIGLAEIGPALAAAVTEEKARRYPRG